MTNVATITIVIMSDFLFAFARRRRRVASMEWPSQGELLWTNPLGRDVTIMPLSLALELTIAPGSGGRSIKIAHVRSIICFVRTYFQRLNFSSTYVPYLIVTRFFLYVTSSKSKVLVQLLIFFE